MSDYEYKKTQHKTRFLCTVTKITHGGRIRHGVNNINTRARVRMLFSYLIGVGFGAGEVAPLLDDAAKVD